MKRMTTRSGNWSQGTLDLEALVDLWVARRSGGSVLAGCSNRNERAPEHISQILVGLCLIAIDDARDIGVAFSAVLGYAKNETWP